MKEEMVITTIKDHTGLLHEEMPHFEESRSVLVVRMRWTMIPMIILKFFFITLGYCSRVVFRIDIVGWYSHLEKILC